MFKIPVVDIFAGPGGLGEGFSAFETAEGKRPFQITVSAEKDAAAHSTLQLRAYVRSFDQSKDVPESYYDFLRDSKRLQPYTAKTKAEWDKACSEALNLTLGRPRDNAALYERIRKTTSANKPWVLIGGPPCQAYSLVGRSRNKGKKTYQPAEDDRHFLYREYLEILATYRPHVFIMENVRGILTSAIEGKLIFEQILTDLEKPSEALGRKEHVTYRIQALDSDNDLDTVSRYLVRSESHGVPQARHRVILLGVRSDLGARVTTLPESPPVTVAKAWAGLPKLRSGLSRRGKNGKDGPKEWAAVLREQRRSVLKALGTTKMYREMRDYLGGVSFRDDLNRGGIFLPHKRGNVPAGRYGDWIADVRLDGVLNHETRGHMVSDLARYMFCTAFAATRNGRSPRIPEFPDDLIPAHKSWKKKVFMDRFKVQPKNDQSGTITSHIAKDGHYFIHFDTAQCRSMTVREAARLQSFPDNYFFRGNRTQQFTQVGNAVPPLLARDIAGVVWKIVSA